jgi:hypothetical protein
MRVMQPVDSLGSGTRRGLLALMGFLMALSACYPGDGPSNVQDLDVVLTIHDEDVDFGGFATYAMPDSVVHIVGDEGSGTIELPRDYDDLILELAADNMASAGYLREMNPENTGADLILLVGAVGTEKTHYWYGGGCYWSCWGWWPGWGYYPPYGPGYGWGYPPYVGSTTFEKGTIILTLIDPEGDAGEDRVPVVWSGALTGVLSGSGGNGRITYGINQMFTQSPYLGR